MTLKDEAVEVLPHALRRLAVARAEVVRAHLVVAQRSTFTTRWQLLAARTVAHHAQSHVEALLCAINHPANEGATSGRQCR